MADKLGLRYKIDKRYNKCGNSSSVSMHTEDSIRKFLDYIYQGEIFGLKRKKNKYDRLLKYKKDLTDKKSSKFRGVSKSDNRWRMMVGSRKLNIALVFDIEIDAAKAYDSIAKEYYGDLAKLNFPNE